MNAWRRNESLRLWATNATKFMDGAGAPCKIDGDEDFIAMESPKWALGGHLSRCRSKSSLSAVADSPIMINHNLEEKLNSLFQIVSHALVGIKCCRFSSVHFCPVRPASFAGTAETLEPRTAAIEGGEGRCRQQGGGRERSLS